MDHWIMQFKSFHLLSHRNILYKYGKRTHDFWRGFILILLQFSIFWDRTLLYLISILFHVLSVSVVQYCGLESVETAYCRL